MKKSKRVLGCALGVGLAWAAVVGLAQQSEFLSRSQWLKKIGASVTDAAVLRDTLEQVAPSDRVEFTQRLLKAVSRLPANPDEKGAAFVRSAVACIAGADAETKRDVIAAVFAGVPVEYLPLVTDELAKRFNREYNQLTCEQYGMIATNVLGAVTVRNAETDEASVRNTFTILAFLKGADCPNLQRDLLAVLPDDRMRGLAQTWIPQVLNEGKYDAMLAAADAEALPLRHEDILRLIGHASLDRLLADMLASLPADGKGASLSLEKARLGGASASSSTAVSGSNLDYGINRVPRNPFYPSGYQNQKLTIIGDDFLQERGKRRVYRVKTFCGCP
ncbi:MAG TPA: hypothetical protein PL016_01600 [Kiritimatiellia bacterium]|nr:hypothetical protein [Kiritimatiellia bacterium]